MPNMVLYIQPIKRQCKREILYGKQQMLMHSKDICCFLSCRKPSYKSHLPNILLWNLLSTTAGQTFWHLNHNRKIRYNVAKKWVGCQDNFLHYKKALYQKDVDWWSVEDTFLPYRKILRISHMVKSNYRTAAEGKHVAAATRRRRRILQAGFFFMH